MPRKKNIIMSLLNNVVRLGTTNQQPLNKPKLSLFINSKNDNCHNIDAMYIPHPRSSSLSFSKYVNIFPQVAEAIENGLNNNITEYFNIITIPNKNEIGFVLDYTNISNDNDDDDDYAIVHIYSHQDKTMLFKGWLVKAGKKSTLLRHRDFDKAFCIIPTNIVDKEEKEENNMQFSVMVTTGKGYSAPLLIENNAVVAVVDSSTTTTKYHRTKVVPGQETFQNFSPIYNFLYYNSPIDIYTFKILCKEKADCNKLV